MPQQDVPVTDGTHDTNVPTTRGYMILLNVRVPEMFLDKLSNAFVLSKILNEDSAAKMRNK
jgi:hypothetical protein